MCPLSGNVEIGLIFPCSPLGHKSRGKRGPAWSVYQVESDPRISLLKLTDGKPGVIDDVNCDLTLRLSRAHCFLPLDLPGGSGLSSSRRCARNQEVQQSETEIRKQFSNYHRR